MPPRATLPADRAMPPMFKTTAVRATARLTCQFLPARWVLLLLCRWLMRWRFFIHIKLLLKMLRKTCHATFPKRGSPLKKKSKHAYVCRGLAVWALRKRSEYRCRDINIPRSKGGSTRS